MEEWTNIQNSGNSSFFGGHIHKFSGLTSDSTLGEIGEPSRMLGMKPHLATCNPIHFIIALILDTISQLNLQVILLRSQKQKIIYDIILITLTFGRKIIRRGEKLFAPSSSFLLAWEHHLWSCPCFILDTDFFTQRSQTIRNNHLKLVNLVISDSIKKRTIKSKISGDQNLA